MQPLSQHFRTTEFEHGTEIPAECIPIFTYLCKYILEPVRDEFGGPIEITSGYRTETTNEATHGAAHSEHVASPRHCAADFILGYIPGDAPAVPMRAVYDWIRQSPELPFHQVILEHDANGASIVHVSINLDKPGTRQALEGSTHNASPYTTADVVPYVPTQPPDLSLLEA
jgi:hypothetical protein